jgi:hypothetical protein
MRYLVSVEDINGRYHTTEDDEDEAMEWLWRTLCYLNESQRPEGNYLRFQPRITQFNRIDP